MGSDAQDARSLEQARVDLVERLRSRLPEALETLVTQVLSSMPNPAGERHARFVPGLRETVSACLECGLLATEQGDEWSAPIPPIVAVQARRAVRGGVSLAASLHHYRIGYKAAWDFVYEEIEVSTCSERHKAMLLREASWVTASLFTGILIEVTRVHCEELKRAAQTSVQHRASLVQMLLAGEHVDQKELDYNFDAEHLGLVAAGTGAAKAVETLATRLGRRLLAVPHDDGTVWAWLGGQRQLSVAHVKQHLLDRAYADVAFAVGRPSSRMAGFRRTHRLAQAALLVAQHWPQRITLYDDVSLLAHALQDDDYAMSLNETYIVPLASERHGVALCKTLKAFYEAGHNENVAAKVLNVHRHTVERHLRRVEEVTGRSLQARHAEIEVALKLAELRY